MRGRTLRLERFHIGAEFPVEKIGAVNLLVSRSETRGRGGKARSHWRTCRVAGKMQSSTCIGSCLVFKNKKGLWE